MVNAYALADFADGDGIFLGYETTQQGNDVVITNKVDLSDYGITDRVLKIRDPAKGSLTPKKEDAQTGDASRPLVWVVLLAFSGIALAGMVLCRKRKSR